jgi:coproporphyrinogen III oxidase
MNPSREEVIQYFKDQQIDIAKQMGKANQQDYMIKPWKAGEPGKSEGEGIVNYFRGGRFLERGCVNTTVIEGELLKNMQHLLTDKQREDGKEYKYLATGISIIFHPSSPMIPAIHANLRYFEIFNQEREIVTSFFGGGIDLTPFYLFEEDFRHFHSTLKKACDKVDPDLYTYLKKKADDYYYIAHRKEYRGIGGILNTRFTEKPRDFVFKWVKEACSSIMPAYLPIVEKRVNEPYTEDQKQWQLIRRGHYIEFNMHYDAGFTFLFNLNNTLTIENSFMSLPPYAAWHYDFHPEKGSREEEMLEILQNPREWA